MYVCKCLYMQKQLKSLEINSNLPVLFTWTNFFFFLFVISAVVNCLPQILSSLCGKKVLKHSKSTQRR